MNQSYRIKSESYIHRKVAGTDILVPIGKNIANFNGYVELNPTASFLWDAMKSAKTEDELTAELAAQFHIPEETARQDASEFIRDLLEHEMAEAQ